MAKPRPDDTEAVSLFPFLSILACLIGVLTFMITGIAIGQMDQSDEIVAAERTDDYGPLVAQLQEDRAELDGLWSLHNAAAELDVQLAQATADLDRLRALNENAEAVSALQQRRSQANTQVRTLSEQLAALQLQAERDRAVIDERTATSAPAGTLIRPSGSGVGLLPIFVECNEDNIVLHTNGRRVTVPRQNIRSHHAYRDLIDRVAGSDDQRLIFLVRPESVSIYNLASRVARERQCLPGKIPVPAEGPIDLSLFEQAQ